MTPRQSEKVTFLLLALFAPGLQSCGADLSCDDVGYDEPAILVVNAETGDPVCDASVTVRDGAYEHVGVPAPGGTCDGLYRLESRAGTYDVETVAPGYAPGMGSFSVSKDDCGEPIVSPEGPRNGLPGYAYTYTVGLTPSQ